MKAAIVLLFVVALPLAWLAPKLRDARARRAAVDAVERWGGDIEFHSGGALAPREWWHRLLDVEPPGKVARINLFFRPMDDAGLRHLAALTGLRELNLSGTAIGDEGLAHLSTLNELQILHANHTDVTDRGAAVLARLNNLQQLHLFDTAITDQGLELLSHLPQLEHLDIGQTQTTENGVARLRLRLDACRVLWSK